MLTVVLKMFKTSIKELISIILVYLVGFVTICIFGAFTKEVAIMLDEANATYANSSDLQMFLTALLAVCILVIIFSQWISIVVYRALFHQRKEFNIKIILEGGSRSFLKKIYLMETLITQVIVIPFGIIISSISYTYFSDIYDLSTRHLSTGIILLSVGISILLNMFIANLTVSRLTKFNVVQEMRSDAMIGKAKHIGKGEIISLIIGIILIVCAKFIDKIVVEAIGLSVYSIVLVTGAFFAFDVAYILLNQGLAIFYKKIKVIPLYLAHKNILGYYSKVQPIIVVLAMGIMVSIGLDGMYRTIRNISAETVEQNVYFDDLIVYETFADYIGEEDIADIFTSTESDAKYCTALTFRVPRNSIDNLISGIDSSFYTYGEKMVVDAGDYSASNFDDPTWDGIILPDYWISAQDIGKKYEVTIMGQDLTFIVRGTFKANGFRGRYGFVSKSYLQSVLNVNQLVNGVYVNTKEEEVIEKLLSKPGVEKYYHTTKEELRQESYDNVISGSDILTVASYAVTVCAFLMIFSFIILIETQNVLDIARLRSSGMRKFKALFVFISQILIIILHGFIMGIPLAYVFVHIGTDMTLSYIDVIVPPCISVEHCILIAVLLVLTSIGILSASVSKGLKKSYINQLRVG